MGESNRSPREVYRFGAFRLDLAARRLTRSDEPVSLPPKAFELLQHLVRNADRAVARTELLDTVWRDTIVEEGNLGWNMSVLRKALDDGDGRIIETVRGYGYRFALEVRREQTGTTTEAAELRAPPAPHAAASAGAPDLDAIAASAEAIPEPTATALATTSRADTLGSSRFRRWLLPAIAGGVALLALMFVLRTRPDGPPQEMPVAGARDARPRLAVLPFENLSARSASGWLATAIAEMLNGELALDARASTTPGESVVRVAGALGARAGSGLAPATLSRLRRELGIDLVVVGNFLLLDEGKGLRVDYRLQDVADGRTLFAGSESGRLEELFELVGRAGGALRDRLPAIPAGAPPAPGVTPFHAPTQALQAYAEGVDLRRSFRLAAARPKFEGAIEIAPDFAVARAALADLLSELGYIHDALAESRRALAAAGSLAPVEKLAMQAKNRELEGRWAEAAELWSELAELDPATLEPQLALARALAHAGRHGEARATLDALARRPAPAGADPRIEIERGWVERYAQDFAAMKAAGERALAAGRAIGSDYVQLEALSLIGWADLTLGTFDSGLEACTDGQTIAARIGHNRLRILHSSTCGWIRSNLGQVEEAERDFARSAELAARDGHPLYQAGAVLAIGWLRAGAGRIAEAGRLADEALALARGVGDHERELNVLELVSHVAFWSADLARAEEATVEALAKSREINLASRVAVHLGALGKIRRERGDPAAALAAHEEARRILPRASSNRMAARDLDLALTRLEGGDANGALDLAELVEKDLAEAPGDDLQRLLAAAIGGRAALRLGRADEAKRALARLDEHHAAIARQPLAHSVLAGRAELLGDLGDTTRAEAAWFELATAAPFGELALVRLVAELRSAELAAARDPGQSGTARLAAARDAARAAKLGRLLGERL